MVVSLKSRGKKLTSSSPSRQRCLLLSTATLCLLLLSSFFIAINLDVQQETLRSDIKRQQPAAATKQQQETGQSQIQLSHFSKMNRYPDEYKAVREHLRGPGSNNKVSKYKLITFSSSTGKNIKLLSFGSSTGEEAITLATMYYPDDNGSGDNTIVFGVDLHQESIDKAKASWASWVTATTNKGGKIISEGKVTFFNGRDTNISAHGPYDAIFANSVLCYHDVGVNPKKILEKFPFEQFESSLGYLDANLKVDGILAIVNTNHHFSRSEVSKRYTPLTKCSSNFVPKVDAETIAYEKKENRMEDCVWVKKEKSQ